ncbi:DUF3426 domain-containing protein [Luteimonas sp. MJ246]|uniref:DUF3426 domain-containing protein n=1 Tax=Luteimonas sp. MJ174 TaxID=3129237 RepID=UPI0031BB0B3C
MFVNCPSCRGLVATDPATDLPPERCPRCAAPLRDLPAGAAATVDDARSGVAAAISEAFDMPGTGAADPADDGAAQPAISIATLLQVPAPPPAGPEPEPEPDPEPKPEPGPAASRGAVQVPVPADDAATPAADRDGLPSTNAAPTSPLQPATGDPAADAGQPVIPDPAAGAAQPTAAPPPPKTQRAASRAAPSFARARRGDAPDARAGHGWALPAAVIALALLLALQWLLADRARLAGDPGWRPVVAGACGLLRCTVPPWREAGAFTLLERDVRPHPRAANALRIAASFRNDAAWAQPWPGIVLTLSDIDGRPLGTREFTAAEYLGGRPPSDLLASGQGAVIRMDVLEPGPGAVSFAFDFRDGPAPMAGAGAAR